MADGTSPTDVPALPATEGAAPVALAEPTWRRRGRRAMALAGWAVGLGAGSLLVAVVLGNSPLFLVSVLGALGAVGCALVGTAYGVGSAWGMLQASEAVPVGFAASVGALGVVGNALMTLLGALVAMATTAGFARGRQLRSLGRVLLPKVGQGGAWADLALAPQVPEALRAELAERWRENGRTEHASVAAFARLTLDLMALGAPPELLASANRDAADEARHTQLCFSLARALDGRQASPGPFPEAQGARTLPAQRPLALAQLAVDSLVDGALHEGVSARVVAQLAKRCQDPATRAVLLEIAADEGRHAAHGWDVAEWCLAQGGAPVASALRGAAEALPSGPPGPGPGPAREGALEPWGIHGHALEAGCYAAARANILARVQALTAPALGRAA